jgi:restriction endonuclease Mrr
MKPKFKIISSGTPAGGLTPDNSALAIWADMHQGEHGTLHVAVIDPNVSEDYARFVASQAYKYLFSDALFVTTSGQLLASYIEENWESHADDLAAAFSDRTPGSSYEDAVAEFLHQRDKSVQAEAEVIVGRLAESFARLVASNPTALDHIEWRDAERMLAEVFEGLGFRVELTPSSKDGGRDIILSCTVLSEHHSYVVEVKHWRSGKRVGSGHVHKFLQVVVNEKRSAGLFLATYGLASGVLEAIADIERHVLRFGEKEKIVSLCQIYARGGGKSLMSADLLPQLLFADTVALGDKRVERKK